LKQIKDDFIKRKRSHRCMHPLTACGIETEKPSDLFGRFFVVRRNSQNDRLSMKANLFMDSLFLAPEKNLNKFCENTPKNKIPRCYLLWKDSKFPRREAERRRCKSLPENFFKKISGKASKTKNLRSHYV
ncbi:MAG: hypothetical protein J6N99_04390, partial [Schwartzia sp.]|nr:hypothetical protein [Schwartzia sp. (in: firmicutes)]